MKLRLEPDDVLFLVQRLACEQMRRSPSTMTFALETSHAAVQEYLGVTLEFVIENHSSVDFIDTLWDKLIADLKKELNESSSD